MKKLIPLLALAAFLPSLHAVDQFPSYILAQPAITGITGSESIPIVQSGNLFNISPSTFKTWIGGGSWGTITGTLSAQTDLQAALNAKQNTLTFSTGLTNTSGTVTVNPSQVITALTNLTSNGFVKTSGGAGTLSIDTTTYQSTTGTLALGGFGAITGALPTANGGLPTQTGNSGKFLTTNGTSASWATVSGGSGTGQPSLVFGTDFTTDNATAASVTNITFADSPWNNIFPPVGSQIILSDASGNQYLYNITALVSQGSGTVSFIAATTGAPATLTGSYQVTLHCTIGTAVASGTAAQSIAAGTQITFGIAVAGAAAGDRVAWSADANIFDPFIIVQSTTANGGVVTFTVCNTDPGAAHNINSGNIYVQIFH